MRADAPPAGNAKGALYRRKQFRQDLEGDITSELRVTRPIDFAHAPGANLREYFVVLQSRTRLKSHTLSFCVESVAAEYTQMRHGSNAVGLKRVTGRHEGDEAKARDYKISPLHPGES